jgi:hypothetical protein
VDLAVFLPDTSSVIDRWNDPPQPQPPNPQIHQMQVGPANPIAAVGDLGPDDIQVKVVPLLEPGPWVIQVPFLSARV